MSTAALMALMSGAAAADCYDAPMWRGEPLTAEYIKSEEDRGEDIHRIGHLLALHLSEPSVVPRRVRANLNLLDLNLFDTEQVQVEGWVPSEMIQSVDVAELGIMRQLAILELLWLNGCTFEAIGLQAEMSGASFGYQYLPLLMGDAIALSREADVSWALALELGIDSVSSHDLRLQALADVVERPADLLPVMEAYFGQLEQRGFSDLNEMEAFEFFKRVLNGDEVSLDIGQIETAEDAIREITQLQFTAVWGSAAGLCDEVRPAMQQVRLVRDIYGEGFSTWQGTETLRPAFEAALARCGALSSEDGGTEAG